MEFLKRTAYWVTDGDLEFRLTQTPGLVTWSGPKHMAWGPVGVRKTSWDETRECLRRSDPRLYSWLQGKPHSSTWEYAEGCYIRIKISQGITSPRFFWKVTLDRGFHVVEVRSACGDFDTAIAVAHDGVRIVQHGYDVLESNGPEPASPLT